LAAGRVRSIVTFWRIRIRRLFPLENNMSDKPITGPPRLWTAWAYIANAWRPLLTDTNRLRAALNALAAEQADF
jgi:hypothetical protein